MGPTTATFAAAAAAIIDIIIIDAIDGTSFGMMNVRVRDGGVVV